MIKIIILLLGTGAIVSLKKIYDKHSKKEILSNHTSLNKGQSESYQTNNDKFYLLTINSLFKQYRVSISDAGSFGALCNQIEQDIKIRLLESLASQNSVANIIRTYQTETIKPLNIVIEPVQHGVYVTNEYLSDTLRNLGLGGEEKSCNDKVRMILSAYYAKGIEMILKNFGTEFEKLESLSDKSDSSLQEYFENIKSDLYFHIKILKK